jgi:DNA-binding phage protein
MVLTTEQQKKLSRRLAEVRDYGGDKRVAEIAGVTARVIGKALSGGNVRVETMESILAGLITLEAERQAKLKELKKALA